MTIDKFYWSGVPRRARVHPQPRAFRTGVSLLYSPCCTPLDRASLPPHCTRYLCVIVLGDPGSEHFGSLCIQPAEAVALPAGGVSLLSPPTVSLPPACSLLDGRTSVDWLCRVCVGVGVGSDY